MVGDIGRRPSTDLRAVQNLSITKIACWLKARLMLYSQ
jgi:hypothetical protein